MIEKTIVVTGHPVDQIIRLTEEMNIDVIVMGSRGGRGVRQHITSGTKALFNACPGGPVAARLGI